MLAPSSELQRLCRLDENSDPARRWNEHAARENEGDRDGVRDLQKEKKKKRLTDRSAEFRLARSRCFSLPHTHTHTTLHSAPPSQPECASQVTQQDTVK